MKNYKAIVRKVGETKVNQKASNYQPIIRKVNMKQTRNREVSSKAERISEQQIVSMYEESLGRRPSQEQWDAAVKKDEVMI